MRINLLIVSIASSFSLFISDSEFCARGQAGVTKNVGEPKQVKENQPSRVWEHRGAVLTMEFTRDGDRLVTGGAAHNESVVVWDAKTGRRLLGIKDAGIVYSLAISPDGRKIATTGYTGITENKPKLRTTVWDAKTGMELLVVKNDHAGQRPCIAFSPDGKLLATGTFSRDDEKAVGAVQLWHADTGMKAGNPLIGPSEGFSHLKFSPDGKTLAAASWGAGTFVVLWDVETRKQRTVLKIKKTWSLIRSLAFSPDSSLLAWASGNEVNGNAEHVIWNATTGERVASLRTDNMLAWIAFNKNAEALYTVDLDGSIQQWEMPTLKRTSGFRIELQFPTMAQSAALSPDGKTLVIGSGGSDALCAPHPDFGTIRMFDIANGRERLSPEKEVQCAKDEADEAARLAASMKARIQKEEKERQELASLSPAIRSKMEGALATASNLRYAMHLNQAEQAIEYGDLPAAKALLEQHIPRAANPDLRTFEWHYLWQQCQFQKLDLEQQEAICASWQGAQPRLSPDGKTVAVTTVEHEVNLWNAATGKQYATLKMPGSVWHVAFSLDSKYMMTTGGKDRNPLKTYPPTPENDDPSSREAMLWEVNTAKRVAKFDGSKIAIACIAIADDGNVAAIGDWQGTVRVYAVPSGKMTASLPCGADAVNTLAFSPDGARLAVGGLKGTLHLWELATGKETKFDQNKDKKPINSIQFDRRGRSIYATSGDWPNNCVVRRWVRNEQNQWTQFREWKQAHRLALSPNGMRLAISGCHGIALWDEAEDRELARIVPRLSGDGLDSQMAFAPDGKTLLVHAHHIRGQPEYTLFDAESGKRLRTADKLLSDYDAAIIHLQNSGKITAVAGARNGRERTQVLLHTTLGPAARSQKYEEPRDLASISSLAFSPDSQRLALSNHATVFVWHLQTDDQRKIFQSNNRPVRTVQFSADGKSVLSSDPSGIKIWDADTSRQRAHIKVNYGSIGADGASVFVTKGEHTIAVFAAGDGKANGTMSPMGVKRPAKDDSTSDQGDVITSAGGKYVIGLGPILFDATAKKELKRWTRDPTPLRFTFTADEKTLVTTDRNGTLAVWELPELKERHVVPKGGVALALSPDNHTAVLAQDNGAIVLFDLVFGITLAPLDGMSASIQQITFSPNGKSLVTGNSDATLRFWCPRTGAQRLILRPHSGAATSMAFSQDGTMLATGSDATVTVMFGR